MTLVTMVQPSATVLEDAEIAVIEAAILDTSAKLIDRLIERHLYQLVNGRFVECEPNHSGSVRAIASVPSTPLSTSPNLEQPSCVEVVSIKKTTLPASTGLEDELVKLSTNTDETAENPKVVSVREDQPEAVARPGKAPRPDPKTVAKEMRKRKRQAAKAAAAAAKVKPVIVASIVINNDVPMINKNKDMEKKDDSFMLVSPRRGRSVRMPSSLRQKTP
jgi:hypothetical protein